MRALIDAKNAKQDEAGAAMPDTIYKSLIRGKVEDQALIRIFECEGNPYRSGLHQDCAA